MIGSLHVKHHINVSTEHAPSEHLDVQGNNASIKYVKGRMQVGQVLIPLSDEVGGFVIYSFQLLMLLCKKRSFSTLNLFIDVSQQYKDAGTSALKTISYEHLLIKTNTNSTLLKLFNLLLILNGEKKKKSGKGKEKQGFSSGRFAHA